MNKIALISDSTCDLSKDILQKYDVKLLPFRIIYKDKEYLDGVDITPEEVYGQLEVEIPTTSIPSLKDMHDLYQNLLREGYTHAIVITLSSGLSSISNAVQMVSADYPAITSYVYDSKTISLGEGILVENCGEMIKAGKSFEEIVAALPEMKKRMNLFFVVDTLEYLKRGGRIGKIAGVIGEILQIKPIISIDGEGKYFTFDKVRGRKQSINRILEIAREILERKKCKIYLMSGAAREEARNLMDRLSTLNNVTSIFYGGDISPVSGVHSGPGLVGVVIMEEA